ncbi:MAG: hypothetical protein D8M57_13135 [Candidatus Scalindua sp. AMX11]|nr:MAG: hypothetical protein DWQ00_11955 [Candidatus Scalindua sp.]NOG83782.1 hypothetical protein [Planctomycetota bacterium]RZV82939.1 MAG: hypothetical protein EX341_09110 [Candidatus Scalindua sp. SCAELEC01]TDE64439.1 MAG: hypothetical protein D8M57_13135 [Candidatus Scalindua sp. AMX11]GJQ59765.1 MAG: hypothetical protein SCALA701_25660 [Candidatus Scalindua sp.]
MIYCKKHKIKYSNYGPCPKCAKSEAIKRDTELKQALNMLISTNEDCSEGQRTMHDFAPIAIVYDSTESIEIIFSHTNTRGVMHRKYIPLLIGALKNLDPFENALDAPFLDLPSLSCECDKNA